MFDGTDIVFVAIMELGWEVPRFAPATNLFIKRSLCRCHVATLEDRVDLYYGYDDLIPLKVEGLYTTKRPECFRVVGWKPGEYEAIIQSLRDKYPGALVIESCTVPVIKDCERIKAMGVYETFLEMMRRA